MCVPPDPAALGEGEPTAPRTAGTRTPVTAMAASDDTAARSWRRRRSLAPRRRRSVRAARSAAPRRRPGPAALAASAHSCRSLRFVVERSVPSRTGHGGQPAGRQLTEQRSQLDQGAGGLALDVSGGAAEHLGGLLDAEVLVVPQHDDRPRPRRGGGKAYSTPIR